MTKQRNKGIKNPAYSHGFAHRGKQHRLYRIWAGMKTLNNQSKNKPITYNGKTQNLYDWSKELKINYSTLSQRFYSYGWSMERTLSTPVRK